uniref:pancreatic secretory granule membrane major glycoprotein GP2-like n=1 Tax=Monopterus albus TaxID=43700 RepID=UPI0009B3ABBA|nr:pancreatic secretory granule membrane major glycoprotein GP2-like [Monopterus albus]
MLLPLLYLSGLSLLAGAAAQVVFTQSSEVNISSCPITYYNRRTRNSVCVFDGTCAVTGPTVVDFDGQVYSVPDRCAYSLLTTPAVPGFLLLGSFLERRRKDDTATGWLSKTGVTATLSRSNGTVSVFDGNAAQIKLNVKLPDHSVSSCEMQYNDTADSTINCTRANERCRPEGSGCPALPPEAQPYELDCQLLKAYPRACSLLNTTVRGWSLRTGCSPETFCQDQTCSATKFCAERFAGGETSCFCWAILASDHSSLGTTAVCGLDSASVTVVGCLLDEMGIDYSALHLNDQTCRGVRDNQTNMVTSSFDSSNTCGVVSTDRGSQVIYTNTIVMQNSSDLIARQDQLYINFSCFHTQPDIKTMSFRIKDNSVVVHVASGAWEYNLTMRAYTDADCTQPVESSTELQPNQRIWVVLETEELDDSLVVLVTDSCWVTDEPSPNETLRYELIEGSCANPTDKTVEVEGNGLGLSNHFSFNMFQFSGHTGDVYLRCQEHLCATNSCAPVRLAGEWQCTVTFKFSGDRFISITFICWFEHGVILLGVVLPTDYFKLFVSFESFARCFSTSTEDGGCS